MRAAACPRDPARRASLPRRALGRLYAICQELMSFYIPVGPQFEGSPVFPHGLSGVFISGAAVIGDGCVIVNQVTIGSNPLPGARPGAPRLGRGCYVGAGARIIGPIVIGDNARIGANAVVTRDVPANATVVGTNDVRPSDAVRDNSFVARSQG